MNENAEDLRSKIFVSLIIQISSREETSEEFLKALDNHFSGIAKYHELIIVCNGIESYRFTELRKSAEQLKGIATLLRLDAHQTTEVALLAGVDKAIGDYVFQFEEPILDFPISDLDRMLEHCRLGNDVVALCPFESENQLLVSLQNICLIRLRV